MKPYPVLARRYSQQETIERSRFLISLAPAASRAAALAFVAEVAAAHPDATHHCHAFVVGMPDASADVGMSDAGEPHGTAGRPMLDVLRHGGVGDVAAVASRWFGGVKLGRGGLIRAYGGALKRALAAAPQELKIAWRTLRLGLDYKMLEAVRHACRSAGAEIVDEKFGAAVESRVRVPEDRLGDLENLLAEAFAGRVVVAREPAPGAEPGR